MQPELNRPPNPPPVTWPSFPVAQRASLEAQEPARWVVWSETHNLRRDFLDKDGAVVAVAFLFDRQWLVFRRDHPQGGGSELVFVGELFHHGPGLDGLLADLVEKALAEMGVKP